MNVGRLQKVDLREVWKHEAHNFTQWMQLNIDAVDEVLGLGLHDVGREQPAGTFSIDLVAHDANGDKVIIENQLERSDHDHLGKVITYLTAMSAQTAVWIVSHPRPEHVAAIAWLNTNSAATFYLLKVEAFKIGDSLPAPLFTIIVGPPDQKAELARANKQFSATDGLIERW